MGQPQKMRARVAAIEDHAPGLRSLVFETDRRVPSFKPGQFLHLALDPYDPSRHWPDSRCFSIASPPEERRQMRITVSAVGRFTQRIMQLQAGDEVWLRLPHGDFVVQPVADRPVVVLAGGTGIAPFVALFASASPLNVPVRVLYGARRPELLIYSSTLNEAAQAWPDFRWMPFVEDGECSGATRGRLNAASAFSLGGHDAAYYVSGPPPMLDTVAAALRQLGAEPSSIVVDAWE